MKTGRRALGVLAVSVSIVALAAATPVQGQTAKPTERSAGETDSPDEPVSGDVIVTAQRRAERLQDVPITISVVNQKELDTRNITTTTDLVRAVPALTATDQGVFQVRGIGTQGFGRSAEQSVSVVLDGVVLGRALTNSMYDLERVEVLSGPQGTLFGKNANAGVLNVVTKAPIIGQAEAIGHLDVGSRNYIHGYLIGNIPLGDTAALRVSYHHDETGKVVYNTAYNLWDKNKDDGVRARLLWRPTDSLTVNISADYQKLSSNGVNGAADFAGVGVYVAAPTGSLLAARLASCGIVPSAKNNRVCGNSLRVPGVDIGNTYGRKNYGGSLTLDYEFGDGMTFTSITALRKTKKGEFGIDADLAGDFADTLPQNLLDRNLVPYTARTWSQEARIASPATKPVSFVAGLYYDDTKTRDEIDQSGTFGIPLGTLEFRRQPTFFIRQKDYAVFGQVDWRVSDKLKLFVGGRYTQNDIKDFSINSFLNPTGRYLYTGNTGFFSVLPVNSCTLAGGVPYDAVLKACPAGTSVTEPAHLKKGGFSGTAGIQYQVSPDTMIFGRYSRGYKGPFLNESVTYNAAFAVQPLKVDPEYVDSVDLGIKTKIDRFTINASVFNSIIHGFQTTIYVPPIPPVIVANFIQGNAKHALTRGAEVSFFGNLGGNFNLSGGLLYNQAHFNKGFKVPCATGTCDALRQLPRAPRFKATAAGEFHHALGGSGIEGFAQFDLSYSSKFNYGSSPGNPRSPARTLLGLRSGLRFADGRFGVSAFCRNCLDKRYPILTAFDGFAAQDGSTTPAVAGGPVPTGSAFVQYLTVDSYRIYGLTLDARF